MRVRHRLRLALLALLCAGCGGGGQKSAYYSVIDIGTLPRGLNAHSLAISNTGDVVGTSDGILEGERVFTEHAFLWRHGSMRDIGPAGDGYSTAFAVSSSGYVLGTSGLDYDFEHNFVFDGTTSRRLDPTAPYFAGNAVNDAGLVVGRGTFLTDTYRDEAAVWDRGALKRLGVIPGCDSAEAFGINSICHVVGESTAGGQGGADHNARVARVSSGRLEFFTHAFLYTGGVPKDLGTLGGVNSSACAINELDQIAGTSELRDSTAHACMWNGQRIVDLGTLGGRNSRALGINNRGQIVGMSDTATSTSYETQHPFLYENGAMRDLNDLIPPGSGCQLSSVGGINDRGQIACTAWKYVDWGLRPRAVVLDPR